MRNYDFGETKKQAEVVPENSVVGSVGGLFAWFLVGIAIGIGGMYGWLAYGGTLLNLLR